MALIVPFGGKTPRVAESAFLAPSAVLIGDVEVGEEASIWYGAVLRGDHPDHGIRVGARSNIQDNCVLHVSRLGPTVVSDNVTVGHGAKFESCVIGSGTLIGMNAVILQEAVVGRECIVAANALVKVGARFPDRTLVAGVPARIRRSLGSGETDWLWGAARHYVDLSRRYLSGEDGTAPGTDDSAP